MGWPWPRMQAGQLHPKTQETAHAVSLGNQSSNAKTEQHGSFLVDGLCLEAQTLVQLR